MNRSLLKVALAVVSCISFACAPGAVESSDPDSLKGSTKGGGGKTRTTSTSASYATNTAAVRSDPASQTWQSSFMIADTPSVFIATDVPATLTGSHSVTVYVYTPAGSLYQSYTVPFATDVAAAEGEQQAEVTSTGYRVWVELHVAGTFIDMYGMTGTWKTESWVDAATTPNSFVTFDLM